MASARYYKLNADHTVEPCDEMPVLEQAQFFANSDRHVADTEIGEIRISTVFLQINHQFGEGPPKVFETMVFGGEYNEYQWRYSTWDEAMEGHAKAILLVFGQAEADRFQGIVRMSRFEKLNNADD